MKSQKVMLTVGQLGLAVFLLVGANEAFAGPRVLTERRGYEAQVILQREALEATTTLRSEVNAYNVLRGAFIGLAERVRDNDVDTSLGDLLERKFAELESQADAVHDAAKNLADRVSRLRPEIGLNRWLRDHERSLIGAAGLNLYTLYPVAFSYRYGTGVGYWESIEFPLASNTTRRSSHDETEGAHVPSNTEVPTCNVGYGDDDEENSDGEDHDHSGQEQEYSGWDHAFNALKLVAGIGAVGTEMYRGINSELNFERLLTQRKRDIRLAMSMGVDPRIFPPAIQPPYFPAWDQVSDLMSALTCQNNEECAALRHGQGQGGNSSRDMFQRMLRYQLMQQMFAGQGAGASSATGTITTNRPFGNGRNGSVPFPNPDQFIRPLYDSMDNMARQLEGVGQTMGQSMGQYQSYFRQINNLAQTMAFFNQQMLPITQAMDQLRGGASLLRDRLNGLQNGLNNGFGGLQTTTQFGFQQSGSGNSFGNNFGGGFGGGGFGGFQAPAPGAAFGAQFNGGNPGGFQLGISGGFGR